MICYKDRTFCSKSIEKGDCRCNNKECYRYLSKEDKKKAKELKLGLSVADFYVGCEYYIAKG